MTLKQRIDTFVQLGEFLKSFRTGIKINTFDSFYDEFRITIEQCYVYNGWFTQANVKQALLNIESWLTVENLSKFTSEVVDPKDPKKIAIIMAGNIPAVGFHDVMCVLLSGHKVLLKISSDDHLIIPFLTRVLIHIDAEIKKSIEYAAGKLSSFDAVIATGSNNSGRYFDFYFAKYPHVIRKNRNSIAILTGMETEKQLSLLGKDIFDYFGLGCRNVSKLFVPEGYVFDKFFESVYVFREALNNKKYGNNYDYNRAIYLLNAEKMLDNNFLLLKPDEGFSSPVSVVFTETYSDMNSLKKRIEEHKDQIQCIVGNADLDITHVGFGTTQSPPINEYADGVNILEFLTSIR